jgi:vitamin B12 transporter
MKYIATIAALLMAMATKAQNNIDLNPVTVTASRTLQKITATGRAITVVDGKLFAQLPVNSLDELLKYVPGAEVQQRGPSGAQGDIIIRGGTFQQVLVLLDGIKMNDPVTGHFSGYIPIAPYEIERIEILRGPASAIYGAEAVGGVINVITKTFGGIQKEKKSQALASVGLGEYGLVQGNLGYYKNTDKMNLAAGLYSNNSHGQLLRGNNRGYFYNTTGSASAGFALPRGWQLFVRSSVDKRSFAAQNFYTTFVSDTATEKVVSWWNQVKLARTTDRNSDAVDVVYKRLQDRFLFNSRAAYNNNRSAYMAVQYVHTAKTTDRITVHYGAQADWRSIRSNDRGNHRTAHGAVFLGTAIAQKNWHINPAVRLDYDENFGLEVLPQLNASVQWQRVVLRANAGRAIRSADFTERYNNYNKPVVTSGSIGNPDLTAERSWGYDAGIDYVAKHLKISASAFLRTQGDVIDWVPTKFADMPRRDNLVPTGNYALAKNLKSVETRGLELDVAYSQQWGQQQLFISAGATLLRSTSSDSIPSFYIIAHAKALVQGNLVYSCKGLSLAANVVYKERQPQQAAAIKASISRSYVVANLKVQYRFYRQMSVYVAVTNLGNLRYSDLLGSQMPGRWTMAGLNVQW